MKLYLHTVGCTQEKEGEKKLWLVHCNSRPWLGPAAALNITSGQIPIDFRGIFRIACLTTVSFPFCFPWTTSAPLLGMHPRRSGDVLGPGLRVASVTAQAGDGAAALLPALPQGTAPPWATAISLLSAVKQWRWRVLRPLASERV